MGTARRLVLENRLGQGIRVLHVAGDRINLIYRLDNRRVEAHADLSVLKKAGVDYRLLSEVKASAVTPEGFPLPNGLGRLKAFDENTKITHASPQLPEDDENARIALIAKRTSIAHTVAVILMVALSFVMSKLNEREEPQLVTIELPKKIEKPVVARVKPAARPVRKAKVRVTKKRAQSVARVKRVAKPKATVSRVVHTAKPRSLENVGALAALGGLRSGTKGYQGLDRNSMRNIRSAGVGAGGGGVGSAGRGGITGVMPGTGLIAGSSGRGARGEGAGGYGTRGYGGGRAGYGTVSMVGGTAGVSLPAGDDGEVNGGLHQDQILAVLNRNRGQIIYCYEQGLPSQPNMRGVVSTKFRINPAGRVSFVKVAGSGLGGSPAARQVENCIVARMKTFQFPKPLGGVNVDAGYPWHLSRTAGR